jgi:hypothetical protein
MPPERLPRRAVLGLGAHSPQQTGSFHPLKSSKCHLRKRSLCNSNSEVNLVVLDKWFKHRKSAVQAVRRGGDRLQTRSAWKRSREIDWNDCHGWDHSRNESPASGS